jgi:hypothetical protein
VGHGDESTPGAETNTRDAQRVSVDAFVKVTGADREFVFRTRDLSRTGVFLYTKVAHIYPFKVGSSLVLELYDYDQSVSCKVVVVRVVEPGSAEADLYPTGFGVRILEIDGTSRARLEEMIERAAQAGDLY